MWETFVEMKERAQSTDITYENRHTGTEHRFNLDFNLEVVLSKVALLQLSLIQALSTKCI